VKTVSDSTPNVGETITFTVTLSDNGPGTATGVSVEDLLPAGLTFISATPSQGTYSAGGGLWTVGTVTTTLLQTLQIQARVTSPNAQTNTATIASSDQFDPNPANNSSSVTITPVDTAPVAHDDSYGVTKNDALTVAAGSGVLANDTDVNGDSLTAVLVSGPAHGTLVLNANGSFTYTPAAGYTGADSFTYKANDGQLDSNVATVSLTVSDSAPVANNDSYTANKNNALTVPAGSGVLANDTDANGDSLSAVLIAGPAHGTLALSSNGAFTYTPAAGYTGPDSFQYQASDGALLSNTATVTLTVS